MISSARPIINRVRAGFMRLTLETTVESLEVVELGYVDGPAPMIGALVAPLAVFSTDVLRASRFCVSHRTREMYSNGTVNRPVAAATMERRVARKGLRIA
jgi:hypothetical protein